MSEIKFLKFEMGWRGSVDRALSYQAGDPGFEYPGSDAGPHITHVHCMILMLICHRISPSQN